MKKEDLKVGTEIQDKLGIINSEIETLKSKNVTDYIDIRIINKGEVTVRRTDLNFTEKANTNLEYLNQLYRDNVLRTLEDCKSELEKEFELLGN